MEVCLCGRNFINVPRKVIAAELAFPNDADLKSS